MSDLVFFFLLQEIIIRLLEILQGLFVSIKGGLKCLSISFWRHWLLNNGHFLYVVFFFLGSQGLNPQPATFSNAYAVIREQLSFTRAWLCWSLVPVEVCGVWRLCFCSCDKLFRAFGGVIKLVFISSFSRKWRFVKKDSKFYGYFWNGVRMVLWILLCSSLRVEFWRVNWTSSWME